MKIEKTPIESLIVIVPQIFEDNRGWFMETYHEDKYSKVGINSNFVQDNQSLSVSKGTLRGLHFQTAPYEQAKLVRCIKGSIYDVAVDLRKSSPTYLQWFGIVLDDKEKKQMFIPRGFAHGFLTLEDNVEVAYKVDNIYSKENDGGIHYLDSNIGVEWNKYININEIIVSDKDAKLPLWK